VRQRLLELLEVLSYINVELHCRTMALVMRLTMSTDERGPQSAEVRANLRKLDRRDNEAQ